MFTYFNKGVACTPEQVVNTHEESIPVALMPRIRFKTALPDSIGKLSHKTIDVIETILSAFTPGESSEANAMN